VVEHVVSMLEALGLIPNTHTKGPTLKGSVLLVIGANSDNSGNTNN
jgi:hypothetical protein